MELSIHQTLHLNRGCVRLLTEHVELLDAASVELFRRHYTPHLRDLERRIVQCAITAAYPTTVSGFVRIELSSEGVERLTPVGVSLYDGYALRSLTPHATTLRYDLPLSNIPSSSREAIAALAHAVATTKGATLAVQCTSNGMLIMADNAPLYGIIDHTILTSQLPAAERRAILSAINVMGYTLHSEPLHIDHIASLDELFYVDHRGVTSLASCDGYPLMTLAAERIATALEAQFRKA